MQKTSKINMNLENNISVQEPRIENSISVPDLTNLRVKLIKRLNFMQNSTLNDGI